MADQTDSRIHWENLKKGDTDALAAIYRTFAGDLLNYAFALSRSRDMAMDGVQELFVNLWSQRSNLTVPVSVKAYLIISLRNIVVRKITAEKRRAGMHVLVCDEQDMIEPDVQHLSIATEEEHTRNKQLYKNMGMLTKRQQEILHLRFIQELDYTRIAEITGLTYQAARNTVYKALQALRSQMVLLLVACLLVS